MPSLRQWVWGAIGLVLILVGLFVPIFGWVLKIIGISIIIVAEVPVLSPALIKLVNWLEKKTGWKIHERITKMATRLKIFGLKSNNGAKKP